MTIDATCGRSGAVPRHPFERSLGAKPLRRSTGPTCAIYVAMPSAFALVDLNRLGRESYAVPQRIVRADVEPGTSFLITRRQVTIAVLGSNVLCDVFRGSTAAEVSWGTGGFDGTVVAVAHGVFVAVVGACVNDRFADVVSRSKMKCRFAKVRGSFKNVSSRGLRKDKRHTPRIPINRSCDLRTSAYWMRWAAERRRVIQIHEAHTRTHSPKYYLLFTPRSLLASRFLPVMTGVGLAFSALPFIQEK